MVTWRQDQPADPYQVLGVGTRAERDEIVRAYRQLARACHPDARPGDPAAAARFRTLALAYQLLADPARRARYDRAHLERDGGRPGGPPEDGPRSDPQRAHAPGPAARRVPVRYVGAGPAEAGGQAGKRPGGPAGRPPLWAGPVVVEPPAGRRRFPADPWGWWA